MLLRKEPKWVRQLFTRPFILMKKEKSGKTYDFPSNHKILWIFIPSIMIVVWLIFFFLVFITYIVHAGSQGFGG
ncbi:MAG: hypothetical protein KKE91_03175 [Candidatus Omnitrophica bacterium]|nr:hypothetical protein [Candidatus Omnitrophota bacterium]